MNDYEIDGSGSGAGWGVWVMTKTLDEYFEGDEAREKLVKDLKINQEIFGSSDIEARANLLMIRQCLEVSQETIERQRKAIERMIDKVECTCVPFADGHRGTCDKITFVNSL